MTYLPRRETSQLIGREAVLAHAVRRLEAAAAGTGQLLLVAGEAGIGKTRLLGTLADRAGAAGLAVVRAAAYPGDGASSGGLLLDLADALRATEDRFEEGRRLAARLRYRPEPAAAGGDAHHRRRVLVQDLVDVLLPAGPGGPADPVLVILEDLHWADELSIEVLGRLAARIPAHPWLVAGAYRSDELRPGLPIREARRRLLTQRLAEELRLDRLDPEGTAALAGALLGRPLPAGVAAALHERSDGIPLHVEELLSAIAVDALEGPAGAAVQAAAVPDTLAEAVLGRLAALPGPAGAVARAAAVIGRSFDFDLLTTVTGLEPAEVASALRELRGAHLVLPGAGEARSDFRHALIRDALYDDTDLPTRRALHERVARAALARGDRGAPVSAHLELAGRADLAFAPAREAAGRAASLSAHREAFELYRRAVRTQPPGLPAAERISLYLELAGEAAAADDNRAAGDAYALAHSLITRAGDARAAAAMVPRWVAVGHLLGDGLEARIGRLRRALADLDGVTGAEAERSGLHAAMAAAYMLDRRLDEAIAHGERGRGPDSGAGADLDATLGSVLVFAGRMDEGWAMLEGAVAGARGQRHEAEAARAYRMIASCASVLVEYPRAEHWLAEGIRYAEAVELWNHRHYLAAHQAHVAWATGDWARAGTVARHALADGRGGITTRITARYVLGYLALGRGDPAAAGLLEESLNEASGMGELQRISPPLWGLAEAARCAGDPDRALEACERGYRASAAVSDAAYLFPFLLTGVRAHLDRGSPAEASAWAGRVGEILLQRSIPGPAPAIGHARGLIRAATGDLPGAQSDLVAAQREWASRGRFWELQGAGLDLAGLALRSRRRGAAARLAGEVRSASAGVGATVLVAAADALIGPADRRPDPWHPLTHREYEVARLVSEGLTNRQIAQRLTIAPKTASAHVEHILAKLGAALRTEIAAWCANVVPLQ